MRVVLGLSVTASSAVWVLVDTYDGSIIADEVVALDTTHEIARAAARSVQEYATQSSREIDGVRLVWDEEARHEGIRLRTKLRLFGFDVIETVTEDAAREGRNRTARHIAPHMVLAYGAARADLDGATDRGVLRRLTEKVPAADRGVGAPVLTDRFASTRIAGSEAAMRASDRWRDIASRVPGGTVARVAAGFFAVAVTGVVGYALLGSSASHEVPQPAVAEAVVPAPPAAVAPAPEPAPAPAAPAAALDDVLPAAVPEVATAPQYIPESEYIPSETVPEVTTEVATATATGAADVPAATMTPDLVGTAQSVATGTAELPATAGEPHLTGVGPAAGPAPLAQATPSTVATTVAPAPTGPIGALFGALP